MKVFALCACIALIAGAVIFLTPLKAQLNEALQYSSCDTPLPYTLGSIDQRFNLTQSTLEADIQSATSLWSQAEGKQLFVQDARAQLKVNFVYDQRQLLDTQIEKMQQDLGTSNSTLQQQIQDYYNQQAAFKQKLDALNSEIEGWNQKGGAPADVYQQLTQQQKTLQTQADQLNSVAQQLNLSTDAYNTQVNVLNQDVNKFNTALSQKPEEGLYDPNNQTITIYFASNQSELIHTLAHEFGHSLGMEHVGDPNGVMYPYTSKTTSLTADDKNELVYVCRKQFVLSLWAQQLRSWIAQEKQVFMNTPQGATQ